MFMQTRLRLWRKVLIFNALSMSFLFCLYQRNKLFEGDLFEGEERLSMKNSLIDVKPDGNFLSIDANVLGKYVLIKS